MCPSSPLQTSRDFLEIRVNKSLAIPMPASHMQRTESEVQLHEDTAVAEYRDQCMFNRLVTGIRSRQQQCSLLEFSHDSFDSNRDRIPMVPATSESIKETEESIVSTRNHSSYFSQNASKVTPMGSGDYQICHQSGAYHTDESMQMPCYPSQEMEDWAIDGFDEAIPISNVIQDISMIQTEVIPDMYESDDYSCYDDEVFDIDL